MDKPLVIGAEQFTWAFYPTKPLDDYKVPAKFPACCNRHKKMVKDLETWFEKFPNCCDEHKKLLTSRFPFDKSKYEGVIEKILNQSSYTEDLILKHINLEDWYNDITDYIDYNLQSFGHPRVGDTQYLEVIIDFLKNCKEIPEDKAKILLRAYTEPAIPKETTEEFDFLVVYNAYANWLKLFPFEISYFKDLKSSFERNFPLLKGEIKVNRYSNIAKAGMKTPSEMLEFLFGLTRVLLSTINTVQLQQNGLITEPKKQRLEFINANHRIETDSLLSDYTKGERKYIKTIKKWLEKEKAYFKDLSEIFANPKSQVIEKPKNSVISELEKYGLFDLHKTKGFNTDQRQVLEQLLIEKQLPYKIALLSYLGFFEYAIDKHFKSQFGLIRALEKMLNSSTREIKGNINVLKQYSKENKSRYTSHLHKKEVEKDYQNIK